MADWPRVRELFEAALEESPVDADGWLRDRGADADLRREVLSLLDHHSRAGNFLVDAIADRVPALLDEEDTAFGAGVIVGHYRIDRELGRGAMGRVYPAPSQ